MIFDQIIAQPAAVRVLRRAVSTDRVASSYLFEGPSGVGKQRAATALGLAMLCEGATGRACGRCGTCRRVLEGKHPDFRVFAPRQEGHGNIQVEFVRSQILPVTQYAPFEASSSLLVFPQADVSFPQSHPESANALLKTLEEPRPGVHFILLAERPERLLSTIRSRCQSVRFAKLPPAVVMRVLEEQGVPEPQRAAAAALCDGRADRALLLAQSGTSERILDQAVRIDACLAAAKPGTLVALAEELAKSDDLELALETLATFYRDVAVTSLGLDGEALAFRHRADVVAERADRLPADRAAKRVALIRRAVEGFERNANRHMTLDALLFDLRAT